MYFVVLILRMHYENTTFHMLFLRLKFPAMPQHLQSYSDMSERPLQTLYQFI